MTIFALQSCHGDGFGIDFFIIFKIETSADDRDRCGGLALFRAFRAKFHPLPLKIEQNPKKKGS